MKWFGQVSAVFHFAFRRLAAQPGLALANLFGLTCAVMLVVSIPLYVDATFHRMLRQELDTGANMQGLPPFAFMFHYVGSWAGARAWPEVAAADAYLSGPATDELGLAPELTIRSLKTDRFHLFPDTADPTRSLRGRLGTVSLGAITGLRAHVSLVAGAFPAPAPTFGGEPLEALVSEALANRAGLDVGETYIVFDNEGPTIQIPVRVVGIWVATDPGEPFWFTRPETWQDVFLVPEATFLGALHERIRQPISEAVWYLIVDGSGVRTGNATAVEAAIGRVQMQVANLLPKTLVSSPLPALQRYQQAARQLMTQLYVFSLPLLSMDLLFVGLVAGMTAAGRRNEVAILRSRGVSARQVIGTAAVEALILGLAALALGLPAGMTAASAAANARGFLDFTTHAPIQVALDVWTLTAGLVAVGLGVLAQVLPVISTTGLTIVSQRQERVRMLRPPWWQRAGLDFLLLAVAAYGAYQLRQTGELLLPANVGVDVAAADPFRNPLLLIVPFVAFLGLALLLARVLPLAVAALAWLAARTPSVAFLLAARQFARMPGFYAAPLILTVVTLSLSAFIASTARSLDHHLYEQVRYSSGAEMVVRPDVEIGVGGETEASAGSPGVQTGWYYVPVAEYLCTPGVQTATRVGGYRTASTPSGATVGSFMGIDSASFAQTAHWRPDFAAADLDTLMGALTAKPDAVLIPSGFLVSQGLRIGDPLRLYVNVFGQEVPLRLIVAGSFELFPAWNPRFGQLFVGNLDHLHGQVGSDLPATVWLALIPGSDRAEVRAALRRLNPYSVVVWPSADEVIAEQERPERQGLIGIFSVGFLAVTLLAVVGFFLHASHSLQRRTVELAVLRTLGISAWQVVGYLTWEMLFLMVCGLGLGVALGALGSQLWIPYYRVGGGSLSAILPLQVEMDWPAVMGFCALFGLLLLALLGLAIGLLRRLRLSQAIKLLEVV
jgi:putative ABC transport system permease protein